MIVFRALLTAMFVAFVVPVVLQAQDNPPPHCCPRSGIMTVEDEYLGSVPMRGEFVISLQMLEVQQTTRARFVDQISEILFPGKSVELVIVLKQTDPAISADLPAAPVVASEDGLLAVQQIRVYRLPRQRVSGDQLERINTLYLTDGEMYVKVIFVDTSSQDGDPR